MTGGENPHRFNAFATSSTEAVAATLITGAVTTWRAETIAVGLVTPALEHSGTWCIPPQYPFVEREKGEYLVFRLGFVCRGTGLSTGPTTVAEALEGRGGSSISSDVERVDFERR